jgi:2-phospho-L-lactate/phosphoenolpyruvate guanylyltransferase
MACLVVIPVKSPGEGKSRLSGVLDAPARARLARAMLLRVHAAVATAGNVAGVILAGTDRNGLPAELPLIAATKPGLNTDLAAVLEWAKSSAARRLVIIAGDLPLLAARDVELLAAASDGIVAIAPDRHETGTNALSLPLPQAAGFRLAFGPDSYALHRAEAQRLALAIQVIRSRGLAHDIDEPADLDEVKDHGLLTMKTY